MENVNSSALPGEVLSLVISALIFSIKPSNYAKDRKCISSLLITSKGCRSLTIHQLRLQADHERVQKMFFYHLSHACNTQSSTESSHSEGKNLLQKGCAEWQPIGNLVVNLKRMKLDLIKAVHDKEDLLHFWLRQMPWNLVTLRIDGFGIQPQRDIMKAVEELSMREEMLTHLCRSIAKSFGGGVEILLHGLLQFTFEGLPPLQNPLRYLSVHIDDRYYTWEVESEMKRISRQTRYWTENEFQQTVSSIRERCLPEVERLLKDNTKDFKVWLPNEINTVHLMRINYNWKWDTKLLDWAVDCIEDVLRSRKVEVFQIDFKNVSCPNGVEQVKERFMNEDLQWITQHKEQSQDSLFWSELKLLQVKVNLSQSADSFASGEQSSQLCIKVGNLRVELMREVD